MEIRVLQYFLKIAELENITKAAEALHITQPALSRQLAELESELGTQLLLRGKRKTTLTEDGLLLQKRAQEITSLVHKTKAEIAHAENHISGPIHIGCAETKGMQFLFQIQKELLTTYPKISLHLYDGNEPDVMEKLDKGLLDFGVLTAPSRLHHYESICLPHKDHWGVLLRKDSPLATKPTITYQDLWHLPLILSQQAVKSGDIKRLLHKDLYDLYVTGTYNLIFNAAIMVEEGIGYAVTYKDLVLDTQTSSLTFRLLTPDQPAATYLIWKQRQLFSPAANLLKKKVAEKVGKGFLK